MSVKPKILAFSGSNRKASFNQRLVTIAAEAASQAGAAVKIVSLCDYDAPLYSAELEAEQGIPEAALEFKQLLTAHQGFLIASPEYNGFFTPALKNILDWASRQQQSDEKPLSAFRGKSAVIMATSPGALGGVRGLMMLRLQLANLGVNVLAAQQAVPFANKVWQADGFADLAQQQIIEDLGRQLVAVLTG
jgi:NAD(P)H-dependent FMN reductase